MSTPGKIEVNFDTLLKNYPVHSKLPQDIKDYLAGLNKDKKPGDHMNTSCCLQISKALNACGAGHEIPRRSFWRENEELPKGSGKWHIRAVNELSQYLAERYGKGESVKTNPTEEAGKIQGRLKPRQGILTFAADHTELWDKTTIIQSSGHPHSDGAIMDAGYVWGRPTVTFWEVIGEAAKIGIVPDWLPGWWEVKDIHETYYYYFYRAGTVYATKTRPEVLGCPLTTTENSGAFTIDPARKIAIKWNASDARAESFTLMEGTIPPTLAGTHPDTPAAPFAAKKIQ